MKLDMREWSREKREQERRGVKAGFIVDGVGKLIHRIPKVAGYPFE